VLFGLEAGLLEMEQVDVLPSSMGQRYRPLDFPHAVLLIVLPFGSHCGYGSDPTHFEHKVVLDEGGREVDTLAGRGQLGHVAFAGAELGLDLLDLAGQLLEVLQVRIAGLVVGLGDVRQPGQLGVDVRDLGVYAVELGARQLLALYLVGQGVLLPCELPDALCLGLDLPDLFNFDLLLLSNLFLHLLELGVEQVFLAESIGLALSEVVERRLLLLQLLLPALDGGSLVPLFLDAFLSSLLSQEESLLGLSEVIRKVPVEAEILSVVQQLRRVTSLPGQRADVELADPGEQGQVVVPSVVQADAGHPGLGDGDVVAHQPGELDQVVRLNRVAQDLAGQLVEDGVEVAGGGLPEALLAGQQHQALALGPALCDDGQRGDDVPHVLLQGLLLAGVGRRGQRLLAPLVLAAVKGLARLHSNTRIALYCFGYRMISRPC
jgi:hypothetical protein